MDDKKTLEQIDPNCYFKMLALLYKINPDKQEDFIKRMKTYSIKLDRDKNGGNDAIHKTN